MHKKIVFCITLCAAIDCLAKPSAVISYTIVVPAYIKDIQRNLSPEEFFNEKILARYVLALHAPALGISLHRKNAEIALSESLGIQLSPLTAASGSALKIALCKTIQNSSSILDQECCQALLQQKYDEFPPIDIRVINALECRLKHYAGQLE